jgi:hypothetical protein
MAPRKTTMKNKNVKKLKGGMFDWLFAKKTETNPSPSTDSPTPIPPVSSSASPPVTSIPPVSSSASPPTTTGISGGKQRKTYKRKTQRKR